ncbi:Aste57867_2120 [Aphanomyces stellatus]|uniref:Aste57867_2120 protein n=1 Tax=Aphanomyces stellatus TaxID=120398 RepID=A0A485KAH9_9STRA|nr:hypothetical protein As57867_002115 [Aphanomyces stellatus]VFT79323.1 Aste57867_2120 [Aphanomyces stellatus]
MDVQIEVKVVGANEALHLQVQATATIANLKNLIQQVGGHDVTQQDLFFEGIQCEDEDTIAHYDIEDGSEVTFRLAVALGDQERALLDSFGDKWGRNGNDTLEVDMIENYEDLPGIISFGATHGPDMDYIKDTVGEQRWYMEWIPALGWNNDEPVDDDEEPLEDDDEEPLEDEGPIDDDEERDHEDLVFDDDEGQVSDDLEPEDHSEHVALSTVEPNQYFSKWLHPSAWDRASAECGNVKGGTSV